MISIKVEGVNELMQRLDPRKVQSAARAALERTKTSAKAEAVRQIRQVWNIKKRDLEYKASGAERIKVSGRVSDDLTATLTFYSGGISLAYFGAVEYRMAGGLLRRIDRRTGSTASKKMQRQAKQMVGIRVQVRKGKTTMLRQFFASVKYGKKEPGVTTATFRRDPAGGRYATGTARMIKTTSPGVGTMVSDPKVMKPLERFITDTFNKRITHELKQRGVTD